MNKGQIGFVTIFWVVIILVVMVGLIFFYIKLTQERFNPDLHNCTEWKGAEKTCIDYAPDRTYGALDMEKPKIFNETHSWCRFIGKDGFNAAKIVERPCVSWQPKANKLEPHVYSEYCLKNPSDSGWCKCVKTEQKSSGISSQAIEYWAFANLGRGNDFVLRNFTNASFDHQFYDIRYGFEVDRKLFTTENPVIVNYLLKKNETLAGVFATEDVWNPVMFDVCVEATPK